jgi:heme/copper-type cytochrome/quinol oxidase subunit 4
VNRFFHTLRSERGSIASEFTFGAMMTGILVIGGLWVIAQLEGVSFQVLIQQLRNSR